MFFLPLTKKKKNEPYNKSQIYDSLENLFYANKFFFPLSLSVRTARTETNHVTNFMECIFYIVHSDIGVVVLKLTHSTQYHIQNPFAAEYIHYALCIIDTRIAADFLY